MKVVAWNNGKHDKTGAGYGLKVSAQDRNDYFDENWSNVEIVLPDGTIATVNISKKSFWNNNCRELISQHIGRWLLTSGLAPWKPGNPPGFNLIAVRSREFRLYMPENQ